MPVGLVSNVIPQGRSSTWILSALDVELEAGLQLYSRYIDVMRDTIICFYNKISKLSESLCVGLQFFPL